MRETKDSFGMTCQLSEPSPSPIPHTAHPSAGRALRSQDYLARPDRSRVKLALTPASLGRSRLPILFRRLRVVKTRASLVRASQLSPRCSRSLLLVSGGCLPTGQLPNGAVDSPPSTSGSRRSPTTTSCQLSSREIVVHVIASRIAMRCPGARTSMYQRSPGRQVDESSGVLAPTHNLAGPSRLLNVVAGSHELVAHRACGPGAPPVVVSHSW